MFSSGRSVAKVMKKWINLSPTVSFSILFQSWLKKSVTFMSTDYILPAETCAMVNVALDAKNQALKLCAVEGVDIVRYYRRKDRQLGFDQPRYSLSETLNLALALIGYFWPILLRLLDFVLLFLLIMKNVILTSHLTWAHHWWHDPFYIKFREDCVYKTLLSCESSWLNIETRLMTGWLSVIRVSFILNHFKF